jgi:hypothetical protein
MWEIGTGLIACNVRRKRNEGKRGNNMNTEKFFKYTFLNLYSSPDIIQYTKLSQISAKGMDVTFAIHGGYEKYTVLVGNDGSRTTSET